MGSGRVPEKWDPGEYWKGGIWKITGKVGSGRVLENGPREYLKGGIRASTGKVGSGQVPERWDPGEYRRMVRESTGKVGSGRVQEMWDPGKYRKGGIRASVRKVEILASIKKVGSG